ncbi:MAG TPA: HU family DNA-binding protein [Bryobacteraceae bacterium]|jgi:integration host factor subunit beta|nr:HU family DNA-binding protein [Bryobacteraceae bacterium]
MSATLTKADLSKEIARVCEMPRKNSKQLLEIVLGAMVDALAQGQRIEIRGFGTMGIRTRRPWVGTNPTTGQELRVPAKKTPYFKAAKELRSLINAPATSAAANPTPDSVEENQKEKQASNAQGI